LVRLEIRTAGWDLKRRAELGYGGNGEGGSGLGRSLSLLSFECVSEYKVLCRGIRESSNLGARLSVWAALPEEVEGIEIG